MGFFDFFKSKKDKSEKNKSEKDNSNNQELRENAFNAFGNSLKSYSTIEEGIMHIEKFIDSNSEEYLIDIEVDDINMSDLFLK